MGEVRAIVPARLRQGTVLVLTVLCLVLLAACSGGGSKPFAKGEGTPGPSGKTVPPIALVAVAGLPAPKLPPLKDALATAAGKRDMAIIDSKLDASTLSLTGSFNISPDPSGAKIASLTTKWPPGAPQLRPLP